MKVSIIIPTYNRASLIVETIDSVLQQSFKDFELIVVDDGSTDNTESALKQYGDTLTYVKQKNSGVNSARNYGLSIAKGEYIATLDNDDLWHADKLQIQVKILDQFPESAYIFSNFSIYKSSDQIQNNGIQTWFREPVNWEEFFSEKVNLASLNEDFPKNIPVDTNLYIGDLYYPSLNQYYVLPSSALFRRDLISDNVKFIEEDPICGDWDFFARLSRNHSVIFLDYDTTYNRSHEDDVRITRTEWQKQLEYRIDLIERLYLEDDEFYAIHKTECDNIYKQRLGQLCRQKLLIGDTQGAIKYISKYQKICTSFDMHLMLMFGAVHIPGIQYLLRTARFFRQ